MAMHSQPKKAGFFRFKQFTVYHDRCTMKVGTDAVLLGAWANPGNCKSILEIGTGSGVIALMLAQRSTPDASIDAVEISENDFQQAKENVTGSPWPKKVNVVLGSIQEFNPGKKYDLIVSNPPYFVNSLMPPSADRTRARHTTSLSYSDLLASVKRLLVPGGAFLTVLPTEEGNQFESLAKSFGLHSSRKLAFFSRPHRAQERWLIEFCLDSKSEAPVEQLTLYNAQHQWSVAYRKLTEDFYLKA